jgi:hypothetical protein
MRLFYGSVSLILLWLLYFSLANVLDREGVTGALLAPNGQSAFGLSTLALLFALRLLCVLILPSLLAGWLLSRLGQALLLRLKVT